VNHQDLRNLVRPRISFHGRLRHHAKPNTVHSGCALRAGLPHIRTMLKLNSDGACSSDLLLELEIQRSTLVGWVCVSNAIFEGKLWVRNLLLSTAVNRNFCRKV
jgi:hypothetical protein